jgi:hypothetical protein
MIMIGNINELLAAIDPGKCSYQEWVDVGMALKHEGHSAYEWDAWSSRDPARHHAGECYSKWESFKEDSGAPVTGGTLIHMAYEHGYMPERRAADANEPLSWEQMYIPVQLCDAEYLETDISDITPLYPSYDPVKEIIRYLREVFEPEDIVGYNLDAMQDEEGKWKPSRKGSYTRTAGEIITELEKYKDVPSALGEYNHEAGGWIRINPLDGEGVSNRNVARFPYALVESDAQDLETQYAIYKEMQLPIKALSFSGGKSLHAIVKVDAKNAEEYRKRVEYLFQMCEKNGLIVDKQNKNPSRLCRLPGLMRGEQRQYLIGFDLGKKTWTEWTDWIEEQVDNLPEPISLADFWSQEINLKPELIQGILRVGHKLLIAGPSKAGKSFALLELAIAIAEGKCWLGKQCKQGAVLYVNLELDDDSVKKRVKDIYATLQIEPTEQTMQNLDIWNLRGKAERLDQLIRKLIRRLKRKQYLAVILDPIYKVITGDENNASEMAQFCNLFDTICREANCAAIYCHHFSKGSQAGKASIDKASGSGVFGRDPDAILTLSQIDLPEGMVVTKVNDEVIKVCRQKLENLGVETTELDTDTLVSAVNMKAEVAKYMSAKMFDKFTKALEETEQIYKNRTAWRLESTLREFPNMAAINCYFQYPVHILGGKELADLKSNSDYPPSTRATDARKKQAKTDTKSKLFETIQAVEMVSDDSGKASLNDVCDFLECSERTLYRRLKDIKKYQIKNGFILKRPAEAD